MDGATDEIIGYVSVVFYPAGQGCVHMRLNCLEQLTPPECDESAAMLHFATSGVVTIFLWTPHEMVVSRAVVRSVARVQGVS